MRDPDDHRDSWAPTEESPAEPASASLDQTLRSTRLGVQIPGYRLMRLIGEGGMGRVYLAEDTALGRHVAIKVVSERRAGGEEAHERFLREARALAAVEHPNIVQVHAYGEVEQQPYFVMQFVEGSTLAHRLRDEGPLPVDEALRIAAETVEALAAAWHAGIVHRDLKPANILIASDGTSRVADFGLAKQTLLDGELSLTDASHVIGTPYYLAPEQARGEAADLRADVYSLGIVLFEMLTGERPFTGPSPMAVVACQLDQPLPSLRQGRPHIPAAVERLVQWMTNKEPSQRPASYDELRQRLAELRGVPTVTVTGLGSLLSIGVRREPARPRPALVIAAVVVIAAATTAALLWMRRPPPPLAVAVLQPRFEHGQDGRMSLAARALREAALNTVAALDGLTAIGPRGVDAINGPPAAVARAVAADELVDAIVEVDAGRYRVTLQRLDSSGGLLWSSGVFLVDDDRLRLLAETVVANLRTAYPERELDPAAVTTSASPEDFERYLQVWQWIESPPPGVTPEQILDELASIRESSPEFLNAYTAEAGYARYLYERTHDDAYLKRATSAARKAVSLGPRDRRALVALTEVELAAGRLDQAETLLEELTGIDPSSPALWFLRADLLQQRGKADQAIAARRRLVELRPEWGALHNLALSELNRGLYEDARHHLKEGLAMAPGSAFLLSSLAELELEHGEPSRAAEILEQLAEQRPDSVVWSLLGSAEMMTGHIDAAEQAFVQTLELAPGDPSALLSLGECADLQSRPGEARKRYQASLQACGRRDDIEALAVRAQCHARLGEPVRAAEAVQAMLQIAPDQVQIVYIASLVYTLIGERSSATAHALRALANGYHPSWFELPWFSPLRKDTRFVAALDQAHQRMLADE